jgi:ABC-2 type transport system permease protein
MTAALVSITLRALLNRRRVLLLALLGLLLVGIMALIRVGDPSGEDAMGTTRQLLDGLGIGVLLPLVAVIVGTSALGSEVDDGTIVYLLAKPVPRWQITLVKLLVAWLVTSLLVAPAMAIAAIVGSGSAELAIGFGLGAVAGGLEYTAIFVALSLVTARALIIGLAYVVIWEGVVAGLFAGTRTLSVRQHILAVVEQFGGSDAAELATLDLPLALGTLAVVTVAAALIAVRRLETVELRGETA